MITNVSLVTVFTLDQDAAKAFYVDKLGFQEVSDVSMGNGFRWVTVAHPDHPELEVTLMVPGPPQGEELAEATRRALADGRMGGLGLRRAEAAGSAGPSRSASARPRARSTSALFRRPARTLT